ncbi:NACHT domain-containing NTPase [Streptacidiphilus sp. MAP12-16]|uniref:NACHT domain-containing protein n=1 Tax=Streptacidiphilus sp. MAP12-16 TaxID=3156300 RepID=UPI003517D5A0
MGFTGRQDWYQRAAGAIAAAACVAGSVWALVNLISATNTNDQLGLLGFLVGMVPIGAGAVRLLKSAGEVDGARASGKLAAAVEASELAQRTQLLGGDNQPINVGFCFRAAPSRGAEDAAATGSLSGITEYYRRLRPQRLVITGAPGSGKTVLALELMLGLLERRGPDDPVPVRLALAGWDATQTLEEWLADELVDTYRLSGATARALVQQRRVLPVLDGLDEMDAAGVPVGSSRAAAALAELNAYQAGRSKAPLVLTCRTGQYDALAHRARLLDAARVEVEEVTPAQAHAFVTTRVWDPLLWHAVLDALDHDPHGTAARILSTPWLLTLAVTVYEADGDPAELLAPADPRALREHLLGRFVPAATDMHVRAGNTPYQPHDVERWLTVLARYLNDNARSRRTVRGQLLSGTDLVLHRLWPITGNRARVLDTAMCAAVGLLILSLLGWSAIQDDTQIPGNVAVALLVCCWILVASGITWPTPKGIDRRRLSTPRGLRAVAVPVSFGFSAALVTGLATALPTSSPDYPLTRALVGALGVYLPIGLVAGLAFGLRVNLETSAPRGAVEGPREAVRADIRAGCMAGIAVGLATGLTQGFLSLSGSAFTLAGTLWNAAALGLSLGVVLCFPSGIIWAGAWRRYVATLLCTRGRLPWRLGRFLDWAYGAGLVRVSGTAYQFRHRELQDYLAQ